MRRCTRCGLTEAEVESSGEGRGPAYDGYCEVDDGHPAGSQHVFAPSDRPYTMTDGQRFEPAREGDKFLPTVFLHDRPPNSFELGNVLRADSMLPAHRHPDGTVFVLAPDDIDLGPERLRYAAPKMTPLAADDPRALALLSAELAEHIEGARLATKWVVDHADRANEYDRPYAVMALEHLTKARALLRRR